MPGDATSNNHSTGSCTGSHTNDGKPQTACYATPDHDLSLVRQTVRRLHAQCENPGQTRKKSFVLITFLDDGEPQNQLCTFELCTEISDSEFEDAMKMTVMADLEEHNMVAGLFAAMYDPRSKHGETPKNNKGGKKRQRQ